MPYICPYCRARVPENCNSISCDYCRKWCHLECTDLSESQFEIFSKDKSFEWACSNCERNICNKCNILTKDNTRIKCDKCDKNYHLRCAGLSKTAFIPTTQWYCYQCQDDIFPFNNISVRQVSNLSFNSLSLVRHPNQLRSIHSACTQIDNQQPCYSKKCNVCSKIVNRPNTAIPCPCCNCLTHKTCSKLKQKDIDYFKENRNLWECPTCYSNKFPYMNTDDENIHLDEFNSNWSCNTCKTKTQRNSYLVLLAMNIN